MVDWYEAQATRDYRLTSTAWQAQYGAIGDSDAKEDYESYAIIKSGETGTWKAWNLTNLTQDWVDGSATNYGVILWATNEDTDGYDLRFHSSEDGANPPKLEVTYSTAQKTVYFLKDHLGSIRATVLDSATVPVVAYDAFDKMTAYASNTYMYDAYGQRLRKTENSVTKYYVTSGPTTLAEYDGSANLQAEYIYGLRGMVAQLDPSKGYLSAGSRQACGSIPIISAAPGMWITTQCSATTRPMARPTPPPAMTTCRINSQEKNLTQVLACIILAASITMRALAAGCFAWRYKERNFG